MDVDIGTGDHTYETILVVQRDEAVFDSVTKAEYLLSVPDDRVVETMRDMTANELLMTLNLPFTRLLDEGCLSRAEKLQLLNVDTNTSWLSFFEDLRSIPLINKAEINCVSSIWLRLSMTLTECNFPFKREPILEIVFIREIGTRQNIDL